MVRARDGDRRALEALIKRYQVRIAKFVVAQTGDDAHYEDICQAVFVKMVLALPRLKSIERFEPWLYQIARNACLDHLRRRRGRRRLFVPFDTGHETVAAPEPSMHEERFARVESGMTALPLRQRELLALSLDGKRSYRQLAALSRVSLATVKSRLHRAREALREILSKERSE